MCDNDTYFNTGEYRKVSVGISGSSVPRAPTEEVSNLMTEFYVNVAQGPREYETLHSFLTRIHAQFQLIHPFRDGNGRIGRIIMNILILQKGYPILFYSPHHRALFCKACALCDTGNTTMFERMILEGFYASLKLYEQAVGPLFE